MKDTTLPLDFTVRPTLAAPAPLTAPEPSSATPPAPASPIAAPAPTPAGARDLPPRSVPTSAEGDRQVARAFSVAELDRAIRLSLEGSFERAVVVEGEVTNARAPANGHAYFSLKDEAEDASIDCVIYKTNLTPRIRGLLGDGARLRLRGRPTFWAPRGRLQLVADRAAPAGRGALLEALEKLKAKLVAEGLFAPERKRPIPKEARTVGVVTSESGAVIHDICKVAFRRGGAHVLLAPAQVQGAGAAVSVARALMTLERVAEVDVIIVARGGGASDELMAFNDETLVRAVAACRVPVISAVGHEVDVTLVDFAADARAATPSQAAEMAVPDARSRRVSLMHTYQRLMRGMRSRLAGEREHLLRASRRLEDPRLAIAAFQQTLDDRMFRLDKSWQRAASDAQSQARQLSERLVALHPMTRLAREKTEVALLYVRLSATMRSSIAEGDADLKRLASGLDKMSPLKVLARGYAIATREDGRAVRDPGDVAVGDTLALRVRSARIVSRVTSIERTAPVRDETEDEP